MPIRVTFEEIPSTPRLAVAYVKYRKRREGSPPLRTERISQDVNVDFDDTDAVMGIELIGVDAESMGVAARFARERGLGFPRDLSGFAPATEEDLASD
jgi:hypothetical protein